MHADLFEQRLAEILDFLFQLRFLLCSGNVLLPLILKLR